MKRQVIPGIQEATLSKIERRIHLVEPYVKWIQIDVTDKTLTLNESFRDPKAFKNLKTKVNLEIHLMIKDAVREAPKWINAGFKRIIVQVEADHPDKLFDMVGKKAEVGLALDGPSEVNVLFPYIERLDSVLIMMYKAGPSGQSFQPMQLEKVRILRSRCPHLPIEVDGGINPETILLAEKAGADRFVATSAIFKSDNIENAIKELQGVM